MTTTNRRRTAWVLFLLSLGLFTFSVALGLVALAQHAPRPTHGDSTASGLAFLLAGLMFALVGFLIARRQPDNTISLLLLGVGTFWAFGLASDSYATFGEVAHPGSLPGPAIAMALGNWTWVPAVGLMAIFVVLLFPDGHLPSPGWRWLARTSAVVMTLLAVGFLLDPQAFDGGPLDGTRNPLAIDMAPWVYVVGDAVFVLFPVCMLGSAFAAVRRFRRSRGVERMQMKWLVTAGVFFAGFYGAMLLAGLVPRLRDNAAIWSAMDLVLPLTFCTVPLAIGAAVLKYRLYEIDVVINKALVFGALAGFITAVYVGIVVGVGHLAGGGDRPNLGLSITATAVVAVAFQPVRDRVQLLANRLVYGSRATPYEVLSDFADRVGGSYDAAELLPTMARTVAQGVGAVRCDVWLVTAAGLTCEATWPVGPGAASEGATVERLSDLRADRVAPVRHGGELLGALSVTKPVGEPFPPTEQKLLDDVAAQAGLVLRNVRLIEDLRSSRERLVTTQDHERRRLERNLHDGAQQSLVSVALMIHTARAQLGPKAETLGPALDEASEQLRLAIEELRELARGIHPAILTERGLGPALTSLAERSPMPVFVDLRLAERPPAPVEAALYYVAAEALTNVAKYAHASQATITAEQAHGYITLEIADDGIGGADPSGGSGLRGLVDRLAVVDGTFAVHSAPGRGTTVACKVPAAARPDDPSIRADANRTSTPTLQGAAP